MSQVQFMFCSHLFKISDMTINLINCNFCLQCANNWDSRWLDWTRLMFAEITHTQCHDYAFGYGVNQIILHSKGSFRTSSSFLTNILKLKQLKVSEFCNFYFPIRSKVLKDGMENLGNSCLCLHYIAIRI